MLSILPSQRGNSELCRDAVACDGSLFLRHRSPPPAPPSSCPPLLTAPLARGVCSPPLCPTGAHPPLHTGDASAMHRIPRTPEGTPGSRFRRRLVFDEALRECRTDARDLAFRAKTQTINQRPSLNVPLLSISLVKFL